MIDQLLAALVAAIVSAAPAVVPDRVDVAPVTKPPATSVPAVWFDPTVGVYVDAGPWEPEIGTYPTGDHYGDVCVPDPRFPGFGTTRVGAMPCTPDQAVR